MENIKQLEACASELATAAETLARHYRHSAIVGDSDSSPPLPTPGEALRARRSIKANITKLQGLINEPEDFLQQLAAQNQLLACLEWLGGFQVLACIPLTGSVPIKDMADIAGVPEAQLRRVVQTTATAGFLRQPQPGHVAHTTLSALFVTNPSLLDAGMFLSETAAPAALQMAAASRRFDHSQRSNESAYNIAFNTPCTFNSACNQSPRLQRKWQAYLNHGIGGVEANAKGVLMHLDWASLGHVTVVDVSARSTMLATALADCYPCLRFIVQMSRPKPGIQQAQPSASGSPTTNWSAGALLRTSDFRQPLTSRISVQHRNPGAPQPVHNAAVYILRAPPTSLELPSRAVLAQISSELKAHVAVLRANSSATLVLTAHLLPEFGAVDPDVEAGARLRDLSLAQLANDREIEVFEVMETISGVRDDKGHLVLVNKLCFHNTATIAFEIQYQEDTKRHSITPSKHSESLLL
ncbi:hypothetical protein DV735_g5783, partial [Chaetothyriales sp. CBS 134920]